MSQFSFRRPELATDLCNRLEGSGLVDARSGLFLAAPRRVGKSTSLREDLIPEIQRRGWLPVYVDLWDKKDIDPAILLADAIKKELATLDGAIAKAAKAARLNKVTVLGALTIDLSQPGLPANITLADLLEELVKTARRPVVLIVDEAQHALSSDDGITSMFALKAARDRLNTSSGTPQLMLVFTGSNRDKLAHLTLNRAQPFFGSSITPFPLLNERYTDAFTQWTNVNLAPDNQLDPKGVYAAFKLVGHRPEMLREIIGQAAISGDAEKLVNLVEKGAQELNSRLWDEYRSEFDSLTPIQKAVLAVLIQKGAPWSPFSEDSMAAYRKITGQENISTATVQTALDSLRERTLIWRESRGAYALEDQALGEWYRRVHVRSPSS